MATAIESESVPSPFRFNLKALLLITAGVAILLAPYRWFGGFYLFSALMSCGLVMACSLAYRESKVLGVVTAIGGSLLCFLLIMLSPLLFFHSFVNSVTSFGLALCRVRPRTFVMTLACVAVAIYLLAIGSSYERFQQLVALRAKYPFQSLERRLEFDRTANRNGTSPNQLIALNPAVVQRLDEFEERRGYSDYFGRAWSLRELHENMTFHFARAAGFGVARMGSIDVRDVDLPPAPPLELPVPLDRVPELPSRAELLPVHDELLYDFGDPNRSGYVRNRREVSGFEPHQVTKKPTTTNDQDPPMHWQVARLELVSLLRHNKPRVYTAAEPPAMDQLADVPHRELNSFESLALPKLESDEDIVVDQRPNRIEMLGAIRAATNCLECHDAQRGQLLGAFSYEMVRLPGAEEAEHSDPRGE